MTECCITQYILLILPKPNSHTSRRGWIYQQQIPSAVCSPGSHSQTQIFPREKKKPTTWFWSFYNDTRLPVEGLGQIWGGWKEPAANDRTSGRPWGEIYRFQTIPSPPLSEKASVPLLSRGAIDGEECKMESDMSGWDGGESDGKRRKKKEKRKDSIV